MDITPRINETATLIQSYGGGQFTVAGIAYTGSIIVFPGTVISWPFTALNEEAVDELLALMQDFPPELLLVGCGSMTERLPKKMKEFALVHGFAADAMDTGAACRTYNILLAEGRRIAAALIAV